MTRTELTGLLAASLGGKVILSIGRSERTVARRTNLDGGFMMIRLHRSFLQAPQAVMERLIRFLHKPFDENLHAELSRYCAKSAEGNDLAPTQRREGPLTLRNRYHDICEIFADLNRRYFRDKLRCRIAWGREGKRKRRVSVQLGSYTFEDDIIRIHPVLDQAFVPRRYVEYVVFHEMLHVVVRGYQDDSGRRIFHSREFGQFEKKYPHYAWACEWEKKNIRRLLDVAP